LFDDVIRKAGPNAVARQVELRAVPTDAEVRGDGELLRRAVSALVEAALKQCTRRATVELACVHGAGVTRLVVRHDGRKLADQPHARALAEGRGRTGAVGMPLAVARVIALSHGGRLEVSASSDWPTELALVLPE
jgi:K+-sensing histidine kinase KdpD